MTTSATLRVWSWPDLSAAFLALLEAGDEPGAVALVTKLLRDRAPAERVLLDVIAAAQAAVGQLWAADNWSVAREHAATAISERAVAVVAERTPTRSYHGRLTVACVDGEWHALPARILAEVLRLRGWRIDFLGASVPGRHLATHLQQTDADALALSCMLPSRLPRAHAAIVAATSAGVPVIVGGRGFGFDGRRAAMLGADAWAPSATAAADRLAGPDWPPVRAGRRLPVPAPGGAEYSQLQRRRTGLIAAAKHRLTEAFPPAGSFSQEELGSTEEDLAYILDFLAAALYVEDATVFTEFAEWTAEILAARGVPVAAFTTGLDSYRDLLPDCPQAAAMLTAGKVAVTR
ncbi:cobalamin-dependent protein [Natronosporangium hydrolyticum]|uniref:Cobalamin-dependent protein n=1 Tax=Natronosporangium hydrolyticum TaxID=2811111 RepID=A0A895YR86_9ACTN|nr:cobalamin-dependent protein [Natronosporangium hydrolyticum]QSB16528.1 cobalamin-dependent protein [Natronosporangium hydrolyticum]